MTEELTEQEKIVAERKAAAEKFVRAQVAKEDVWGAPLADTSPPSLPEEDGQ